MKKICRWKNFGDEEIMEVEELYLSKNYG